MNSSAKDSLEKRTAKQLSAFKNLDKVAGGVSTTDTNTLIGGQKEADDMRAILRGEKKVENAAPEIVDYENRFTKFSSKIRRPI